MTRDKSVECNIRGDDVLLFNSCLFIYLFICSQVTCVISYQFLYNVYERIVQMYKVAGAGAGAGAGAVLLFAMLCYEVMFY